jgi:hypothetical protein
MPGPVPKHPSQPRRRNAGPQLKTLPAGRKEPVPKLRARKGGWLRSTREWWKRTWRRQWQPNGCPGFEPPDCGGRSARSAFAPPENQARGGGTERKRE